MKRHKNAVIKFFLIFQAWTKTLDVNVDNTSLTKDWVHLDGKSIKGTLENYNTKQQKFINLVSAFSSKRKQVLGFNLVENNKESEIPKELRLEFDIPENMEDL